MAQLKKYGGDPSNTDSSEGKLEVTLDALLSRENLLDPWGVEFVLLVPGQKNFDFDVVSYGHDGKPGGDGEDQDVTNK